MGIFGQDVTIVVDVANVMGSRPDGWWRDRAGAALRLYDQIAELAASGRAILPAGNQPPGEGRGTGEHRAPQEQLDPADRPGSAGRSSQGESREHAPAFVLVLEGAARAAIPRLPSARASAADASAADASAAGAGPLRPGDPLWPGDPLRPGEVRVVEARGSGDDTIVAVVHELPGRRAVVTADRELRARCAAAGAEILRPGWLLSLLPDAQSSQGPRASRGLRPRS